MFRYLFVWMMFSLTAFGFSYDDEDFEEFEYNGESRQIAYGGVSFECSFGCGDPKTDPDMESICEIIESTNREFFGEWNGYEVQWERFDWEAALRGEEETWETMWMETYPEFLHTADQWRQDLRFYKTTRYELECQSLRAVLNKLKEADKGEKERSLKTARLIRWLDPFGITYDVEIEDGFWHLLDHQKRPQDVINEVEGY